MSWPYHFTWRYAKALSLILVGRQSDAAKGVLIKPVFSHRSGYHLDTKGLVRTHKSRQRASFGLGTCIFPLIRSNFTKVSKCSQDKRDKNQQFIDPESWEPHHSHKTITWSVLETFNAFLLTNCSVERRLNTVPHFHKRITTEPWYLAIRP